jgi:hypothetical protein
MGHEGLSFRYRIPICQRLQRSVIQLIKERNCAFEHVGNADDTTVCFDMSRNCIIDAKGAKQFQIRFTVYGEAGIATGYVLDDRGVAVRVPVESRISSFPRRPDRLWGPPNLVSNGY